MMGIFVHNAKGTQEKLRNLGFHCPKQYRKYYYQLVTKPVIKVKGSDTKPKQRGTVIITEKELDQVILLTYLGLKLNGALTTVVRSKLINDQEYNT